MAAMIQPRQHTAQDSLDRLENGIEYLLKFVTIISELVLLLGLAYAGFKLAHKGPTPETLDQIWLVSQVLALDLSAPGLFAMAAQARDLGEVKRARWAIRIAIILIVMSILTMVEGAVTSYLPNISQAFVLYVTLIMMIIRGGAAVGYSVFRRLHKAEKPRSVSVVQPAPVLPAPEPLDYEEIARHLLPLIVAPIQQASGDVTQELRGEIGRLSEQVVNLQTMHITEECEPECEPESDPQIVQIEDYFADSQEEPEESYVNPLPTPKITRKLTTKRTTKEPSANGRGEAQQKALRIIKRTPDIGPTDLSKRANISLSSAKRILALASTERETTV